MRGAHTCAARHTLTHVFCAVNEGPPFEKGCSAWTANRSGQSYALRFMKQQRLKQRQRRQHQHQPPSQSCSHVLCSQRRCSFSLALRLVLLAATVIWIVCMRSLAHRQVNEPNQQMFQSKHTHTHTHIDEPMMIHSHTLAGVAFACLSWAIPAVATRCTHSQHCTHAHTHTHSTQQAGVQRCCTLLHAAHAYTLHHSWFGMRQLLLPAK